MALFPLVAFPNVEKSKTIGRIELLLHVLDGYFNDFLLGLIENLFKVAHCGPSELT